jgi:signal peptidase II
MKPSIRILLFCALSLSLISWDRASKDLAKEYLQDKPARTFLHNGVRLEYVENTGAAASMGDHLDPTPSFWLLGIAPLNILGGLFIYMLIHARTIKAPKLIAFALLFAGGMGNILDRLLFDRHVTDFINLDLPLLRGYIFNFADVWITAGVLLLALSAKRKASYMNS